MTGKRKRDSESSDSDEEEEQRPNWSIQYTPAGALQKMPFITKTQPEGSLDFKYKVKPEELWQSMQRYNNFISEFARFQVDRSARQMLTEVLSCGRHVLEERICLGHCARTRIQSGPSISRQPQVLGRKDTRSSREGQVERICQGK